MIEALRSVGWAVATLRADATIAAAITAGTCGGVWPLTAPVGTLAPYLLVAPQGGRDVMGGTMHRLWSETPLHVKAVGPAANTPLLQSLADAADAALHAQQQGTTSDGRILVCFREQPVLYGETVDGALWLHLGGLYITRAQPL